MSINIDFSNTKVAFQYKSKSQLQLALTMYQLLNAPVIGFLGKKLLKAAIQMGLPVKGAVKATLYQHFVGGETKEESVPVAMNMSKYGVQSILDFSEEGKESEADYQHAYHELTDSITFSGKYNFFPICVFKVTAFASTPLLEKVSADVPLSESEKLAWDKVRERFFGLIDCAAHNNIHIMVDAEESWIQKAIDDLSLEAMAQYNKGKCVVLNTYQMYRKDSLPFLKKCYDRADKEGFILGAKIVRGAYMEKERARALANNYPSPIQDTKANSDADYNEAIKYLIERLGICFVVAGTHNPESNLLAAKLLDEKGYKPEVSNFWFSQLYGMCDPLSFNLSFGGYNVAKYLPYGPVKSVTPYLIRRAEENSSVVGQAGIEIENLKKELKRRG